jgi:hypothetical protein
MLSKGKFICMLKRKFCVASFSFRFPQWNHLFYFLLQRIILILNCSRYFICSESIKKDLNVLTYCQEKITRFKNDNYMLPQIENGRFCIKNERWATQSQLTEPLVIQIISLITGKMVAGQARAMETTSSEDNFRIICRYLNLVKNQRIYCFSSCPKYLPPLCMYLTVGKYISGNII